MEEDIRVFVDTLISQHTKWIVGYVGGIEKVADYILANNIQINSVRMVWSTSAPLLDFVRKKIEKAFQCKVMDQYGCNEVANIAIQCPLCNGLHINSDFIHVDIVDQEDRLLEAGKYGEILVTNLESRAFPLIKYRLGDKSKYMLEKCSCGLPYPLLELITGRTSDSVWTPSGIILESIYLTSIFDDYTDYVQNFRILQKSDYSVIIDIVIDKEQQSEIENVIQTIKNILLSKSKNEIPIIIKCVDKIEDDRGKNRYIISKVALNLNK